MAELSYIKVGDYYIPNLTLDPEPVEPPKIVGRYGSLRRTYLKQHKRNMWRELVGSGKLTTHLLAVEDAAQDLLDSMMPGMAKEAGATEDLKARDPMRWVGLMNNCKARVEEIIFTEIIYN